MRLACICRYCDHKWEKVFLTYMALSSPTCPKCNDKNVSTKEYDKSKIDYYEGAPAFKEKAKEIILEEAIREKVEINPDTPYSHEIHWGSID